MPTNAPPLAPFAALLLTFATTLTASAAVPLKEDLTDCKLPHGEILIPLAGKAEAGKGDLLKIGDGSFAVIPGTGGEKPLNRVELTTDLRTKNTGDIQFLPDEKGTIWAVSGRIVDLGMRYLSESAAMKPDRPAVIPAGGKRPAGWFSDVKEGHTYFIETTDQHYALVRVLEVTDKGASVQYVYQPSGETKFVMAESPLVEMSAAPDKTPSVNDSGTAASDIAIAPTPAPDAKGLSPSGIVGSSGNAGGLVIRVNDAPARASSTILEPYLSTHLRQREMLIQTRLKTLRAPAKTQLQIDKKIEAINDIVLLHADEAVEILVEQVAFVNPRDMGKEFQDSIHPCFAALKKMGKPASDAALKTLRQLDLTSTAAADSLESPAYRAGLLGLVIRGVEGDTVGEFILKRERDATTNEARRALYDQLLQSRK